MPTSPIFDEDRQYLSNTLHCSGAGYRHDAKSENQCEPVPWPALYEDGLQHREWQSLFVCWQSMIPSCPPSATRVAWATYQGVHSHINSTDGLDSVTREKESLCEKKKP